MHLITGCTYILVVLEVLEDLHAFVLTCRAVEIGTAHLFSVVLKGKDIIREDDNLVIAPLMVLYEVLAGSKFVRIHYGQQLFLHALHLE